MDMRAIQEDGRKDCPRIWIEGLFEKVDRRDIQEGGQKDYPRRRQKGREGWIEGLSERRNVR